MSVFREVPIYKSVVMLFAFVTLVLIVSAVKIIMYAYVGSVQSKGAVGSDIFHSMRSLGFTN